MSNPLSDFIVLGSDTDAGKTTFSLFWLSLFHEEFAYWKPIATGESDSKKIARLLPEVEVHHPRVHFQEPVAPPLAARMEGKTVPASAEVISHRPASSRSLLIESFGSPFSPLTDRELQLKLIRELNLPMILVSSSLLGAVGRTLQTMRALESENLFPFAVALIGPRDSFAEEQIRLHAPNVQVISLTPPRDWSSEGIRQIAQLQRTILEPLRDHLQPKPSKNDWIHRDQQFVWHPYTALQGADDPLHVVSAQDEFLHLADGRRIIDGISSWWTIQHGHRFPPLMDALREAMRKFDHVLFAGVTHAPGIELAELLLQTVPWQGGRVFYSDNGSTAVEVALKMAYQFWCHHGEPQRKLFISFENSYHGDTFGAMSVGRDPLFFGTFEPFLFRVKQIPVAVESLAETLKHHTSEIAAVILEPLVQGAGGMQMHSPEVLRQIIELTQQHEIPFIADEVMTGGGRTGTRWAFEQSGMVPDLICAGKTIAGGVLPLAATLVSPKIVSAFESDDRRKTFFHGHSFTAHPLACAVGVANEKILHQGEWKNQVAEMQRFWEQELLSLRERSAVKEVRIRGSIAAMEWDLPGGYLAENARHFRRFALERGVLLRPLGNVLYAMPPFRTSSESLLRIAEVLRTVRS